MEASTAAHEGFARGGTAYARAEFEALKGAPSEAAQARLWSEVRAALAAAGFSGKYDDLLAEDEKPRSRRGIKGRKTSGGGGGGAGVGRKCGEEAAAAGACMAEIGAWRNGDLGVSHDCFEAAAHGPGVACGVVQEPFDQGEDVEYEDDSEDDYDGILKPAFAVDGDPDFESGEPLESRQFRVSSACQVGG